MALHWCWPWISPVISKSIRNLYHFEMLGFVYCWCWQSISPILPNMQGRRSSLQFKGINALVDQKNLCQDLLHLHRADNWNAVTVLSVTPNIVHSNCELLFLFTKSHFLKDNSWSNLVSLPCLSLSASRLIAACLQYQRGHKIAAILSYMTTIKCLHAISTLAYYCHMWHI